MASNTTIEENLGKQEAEEKCKQYNYEEQTEGDQGYRWYEVHKMETI